MAGLTSLFGMGRGEHRRQYHHKILKSKVKSQNLKVVVTFASVKTFGFSLLPFALISRHIGSAIFLSIVKLKKIKAYGQLVLLGFDVTTFTPVAYRRHSL